MQWAVIIRYDNITDMKKGLETERGERRGGHKGTKGMKEQKNRVEGADLTRGVEGRRIYIKVRKGCRNCLNIRQSKKDGED
jgi:hypothetical protein